MKKTISKIFTLSLLLFFCIVPMTHALDLSDAFDIAGSGNNDPLDAMASQAGYDTGTTDILPVISAVIQSFLGLLGVVFLALLIYGGFMWMSARGNEQLVEKAKDTIFAAIIGLIIVLAAYSISYFVIARLSAGVLDV